MASVPKHKIVGGINRREPWAVSWAYEHYQTDVYTITRRLVGNGSPDLPDLVAEVFARLIEQRGRFSNLSKLKSFLYLTTRNICLNHLRRQEIAFTAEKEIPTIDDHELTLSENLSHFQSLLVLSIERLPGKTRDVFKLFYKEQLSNSEIAQRLHMTEKTVANQKAIALKLLKMELQDKKGLIFLLNLFL